MLENLKNKYTAFARIWNQWKYCDIKTICSFTTFPRISKIRKFKNFYLNEDLISQNFSSSAQCKNFEKFERQEVLANTEYNIKCLGLSNALNRILQRMLNRNGESAK